MRRLIPWAFAAAVAVTARTLDTEGELAGDLKDAGSGGNSHEASAGGTAGRSGFGAAAAHDTGPCDPVAIARGSRETRHD
jgi:hypothetical protein